MCDGWTSISRPQPFSQSALLLWASDALRHPGCSPQFTCLCVKISGRVGLNSSRETDLENTGGHTSRWVPPQMSASWTLTSHIRNITTCRFTLIHELCDIISPLPPLSLPLPRCQSLYWHCSFIGARWYTSVNEGIHFGCQSRQGSGHQVQMCQYLDNPDELCWSNMIQNTEVQIHTGKNVFIEAEVLHFHYHWNRHKRIRHSINWIKSSDITQ